jgi:transposase-like protein
MTGRPPRYTAELAGRILQELARGRTMKDICAEPGMPCDNTVRQWADDDIDGFAARYSEARATGASLVHYPTRYTAEIAETIVGEVTSGRTLAELCREPGMPDIKTIKNWVAANREDFSQRPSRV